MTEVTGFGTLTVQGKEDGGYGITLDGFAFSGDHCSPNDLVIAVCRHILNEYEGEDV